MPSIFLFVILVLLILFFIGSALGNGFNSLFEFNTIRKIHSYTTNDIKRIAGYLNHQPYYLALSLEGKKKFINRVISFMVNKNFEGRNGLQVTEEMKVLISACAVQLTFGLKEYRLWLYHTIRIYPEAFYSKIMNLHMKGGTSPGGTISLSWKDFIRGYEDPEDKYNLGLHEMAHALKLDALNGYDFDERFEDHLNNWLEIGFPEFEKMKNGNKSFLRSYGGTNMHEFFAVCVEHFFEASVEFQRRLPRIYNHLCFLLNQDPANVQNDYRLRTDTIDKLSITDQISVWNSETEMSLTGRILLIISLFLYFIYKFFE